MDDDPDILGAIHRELLFKRHRFTYKPQITHFKQPDFVAAKTGFITPFTKTNGVIVIRFDTPIPDSYLITFNDSLTVNFGPPVGAHRSVRSYPIDDPEVDFIAQIITDVNLNASKRVKAYYVDAPWLPHRTLQYIVYFFNNILLRFRGTRSDE